MKYFLLLAIPALAHDMWIEPSAFRAADGQMIHLRLLVGQHLLGDPLPRNVPMINDFVVEDMAGRRPVVGRHGADPAGFLRILNPGLQVVGYYSKPSPVALPAEKFNEYLKEEGLDAIAALRTSRKELSLDVNERFSRCAKSLLAAGSAGGGDRVLGFPLELVAEKNPYTMLAGEALPVRLLYENRPLAGALVVAMNRMNPALTQKARTDPQGRVRLKLPADGMWMIKSVQMTGQGGEYQSLWASLTFEILAPAAVSKR